MIRRNLIAAAVAAATAFMGNAALAQTKGPSSSQTPYVTPTAPGWNVTSVITVGDQAANGYRMVGIPDGLGAYDNNNGTFTVLMNHELGTTAGVTRSHGSKGAFVSEWVIDKNTLRVISGQDLVQSAANVNTWNGSSYVSGTTAFGRLCSADLPATSAFYNPTTGLGTQARIFMNGEENGNNGRAFGFVATGAAKGQVYELPKLGKLSFENSVANPYSGNKTVVIGLDDSTPGQVYIYQGTKTNSGLDIDKAGLTNGNLAGIKVNVAAAQGGASGNIEQAQINGSFTTVAVNTTVDGNAQQANSRASGITEFARPEDGAWADAKNFYFVTTGGDGGAGTQSSRLYKLTFADGVGGEIDYNNGSISMVKDSATLVGKDGAVAQKFDNMTVGEDGQIVIQEDPGNVSYIAKTWKFNPATGTWTQILESDRNRFLPGAPSFLTQDEENSGVIEITSILGRNDGNRYYLGDTQAHYANGTELVEGGQLYVAAIPEPETYALMLAGLGMLGFAARRRKAQ